MCRVILVSHCSPCMSVYYHAVCACACVCVYYASIIVHRSKLSQEKDYQQILTCTVFNHYYIYQHYIWPYFFILALLLAALANNRNSRVLFLVLNTVTLVVRSRLQGLYSVTLILLAGTTSENESVIL